MRGRNRGQTAVIGFILVFGILMLLLVTLQTTAVPAWNQGEEFEHSQQVRDELETVRANIFQTASTGRLTSKSVQLGTRYPRRPFLLNPADPSGRIQTTDRGTIELTNVIASGETGDYWTTAGNRTRQFRTRQLSYRPDYNEFGNAPTTIYENGVLYDRRGSRTRTLTGTPLVDGQRITLVTLTGNLSESGTTARDVTVEPVSAPQQVTSVTGDGPVRIHLPTRLDEEAWTELLAEEFVAEGGHVYDNVSVTPGTPYDTVTISLEGNASYDLRMGRVRIGSGTGQPGPHYITLDSPAQTSVPVGETERVTVEVRDRYNNPVSGVAVAATDVTGSSPFSETATTDENGHATFQYTPSSPGSATIQATFGDAPGTLETANVTVTATAPSGGGADDTGPVVTIQSLSNGTTVTQGDNLNLNVTASDFGYGGLDIYAIEWWSNRSNPGGEPENGTKLDGSFDRVDENVVTGLNTSTWTPGIHMISVQAQDSNGNWGQVKTRQIEVTTLDTTAPSFSYANASAGSLSGGNDANSVTVQAQTSDDTAVDRVEVRVFRKDNNTVVGNRTFGPTFSNEEITLDSPQKMQGNGNYITVEFTVYDTSGNARTCSGEIQSLDQNVDTDSGLTCS
jgi:hypothetical protein